MGNAQVYNEAVIMPAGITLEGRYAVTPASSGFTWARTATRTLLTNTTSSGVSFTLAAGRTTVIDGFSIFPAPNQTRAVGVTINSASPTLRDFVVNPVASGPVPAEAIGIDVTAGFAGPANPRLEGTSLSPSTVNTGAATTSAIALQSLQGVIDSSFVNYAAGSGGTFSRAVFLNAAGGSTLRDGAMNAGLAPACAGVFSQGSADGTLLERLTMNGCPRPLGNPSVSRVGFGVVFDACGGGAVGLAPPVVRDSSATGGVVGGNGSFAIGGAALDGCSVQFERGSFTGVGGSISTTVTAETGVGVLCSYRGVSNMNGANAACSMTGATVTGNFVSTARAYGLVCEGAGAATGSCRNITQNSITAATGSVLTHVAISASSPSVTRNRIGFGGNGTFCPAGASVTGVDLLGSSASLVNNFILGGPCASAVGVQSLVAAGSTASPLVQHNTIVATAGTPAGNTLSVGVRLGTNPGGAATLQSGVFRSNVIVAGPVSGVGATLYGFEELFPSIDPVEVRNNDFFVITPALNAPLYRNEGTVTLNNIGAVNLLMDITTGSNLEGDPQFVNAAIGNYHIGAASPARAAGSTVSPPTIDIDGDARPAPVATNPDIGADEVN
jgi:hypothetical protein